MEYFPSIEDDSDVEIYAGVRWSPFLDDEGNTCIGIYRLYVDPVLRRKGIARELISATIEDIKGKYLEYPIYIIPDPYGEVGPDKEQLRCFYQSFPELNPVDDWP